MWRPFLTIVHSFIHTQSLSLVDTFTLSFATVTIAFALHLVSSASEIEIEIVSWVAQRLDSTVGMRMWDDSSV